MIKGFIQTGLIIFIVALVLGVGVLSLSDSEEPELGVGPRTFRSLQLAGSPSADFILSTDGASNLWIANTGGVTVFGDLGDVSTSSDATGDVYFLNSSGQITNLNAGNDDDVLTLASGIPSWVVAAGGSDFAWTPTTDGVATTTLLEFQSAFISTGSSTVNGILNVQDHLLLYEEYPHQYERKYHLTL